MKALRIFLIPIVGALLSSCNSNPAINQSPSQFTKDTTAILSYLTQNHIDAIEVTTGVWLIIDSAAKGIHPTFNDSINLKYTTRSLADNSILNQLTTPKHFVLDSLLPAIQVVLPLVQSGSKGRIFLPSDDTGYNNWIFQFQLTDVKDYQLKLDTANIDAYLSKNSINAVKDPSGLRYTVDALSTGPQPSLRDEILVNYTARNLSDGSIVDQGNSASFFTSSVILGLQIGLQKMPAGSTFTFYLPSRLAYGEAGYASSIQPNANLIFNVKLIKVTRH
jgi:FKBP-type peptidyl-prolyl cis-trans isomerase